MITIHRPVPECLPRPVIDEVLRFDSKFIGPILSGEKVQTLIVKQKPIERYSTVRAIFNDFDMELQLFIMHRGGKFYKDLTLRDAHLEGYCELSELQDDLKKFYPELTSYTPLYYYRFKVVGRKKKSSIN